MGKWICNYSIPVQFGAEYFLQRLVSFSTSGFPTLIRRLITNITGRAGSEKSDLICLCSDVLNVELDVLL